MSNYLNIERAVREKAPDTVLVAVSKTKPFEDIMSAYNDGARIFGENRVQEIVSKFGDKRPEDMKLYLIGQLQSNKVRKAVLYTDRIESVDSLAILEKINIEAERIGKTMDILFEVNSSGEEQKSGFRTKEELFEAVHAAENLKSIRLLGLMTVGPLGGDEEKNREAFTYTKGLFDEINSFFPISVLSMGMSGDWESAIECGSTEVRIGSAIFGGRN